MTRLHVHVHLDAGRSPASWQRLVESRRVWDEDPYGYRALEEVHSLTYSVDSSESRPLSLARRAAKKLLGLDLLHAWRNRTSIRSADYVVTHTEHEFLAVLLLRRLANDRRPRTICQAVWLWDRWHRLSSARRRLYLALMRDAAVLTVHSRENLAVARSVDHRRPTVLVPFGVRPLPRAMRSRPAQHPIRVLSAGNDRDRDWRLLAAAVECLPDANVRVRSRRRAARRAFAGRSTSVRPSRSIDEFWADLAWCDVVVVPLRRNLHASGVTVVLEAVSSGRAVVVADVGGLRDYFGDKVVYYEEGDATSLAEAMSSAAASGPLAEAGDGTGSFVFEHGLRSIDYARRHLLLIEALQAGTPLGGEVSRLAAPGPHGVGR